MTWLTLLEAVTFGTVGALTPRILGTGPIAWNTLAAVAVTVWTARTIQAAVYRKQGIGNPMVLSESIEPEHPALLAILHPGDQL